MVDADSSFYRAHLDKKKMKGKVYVLQEVNKLQKEIM